MGNCLRKSTRASAGGNGIGSDKEPLSTNAERIQCNPPGVPDSPKGLEGGIIPDGAPGHPMRGVSVHHLASTFLDEVEHAGLPRDSLVYEVEPLVIRPKGQDVVCPRDRDMGSSYVDAIHGEDSAGLARVMLSYTWGYKVKSEIADTLMDYCQRQGLDPKRTYVWICCFCINQHRVKALQAAGKVVPFDEFHEAFSSRVRAVDTIVAVMSPWHDPYYLKRVWCDFEMFTAMELQKNVVIAMPPHETEGLRNAFLIGDAGSSQEFLKVLGSIDVQKAEASMPQDKDQIFQLIETGPGFDKLNSGIVKQVQNWIVVTCEADLRRCIDDVHLQREECAVYCVGVANLLRLLGFHERTLAICEEGLELRRQSDTWETYGCGVLLENKGLSLDLCGRLDEAVEPLEIAVEVFDKLPHTKDYGDALRNLASIKAKRFGRFDGEMELYEKAHEVYLKSGSLQTLNGAATLRTWAQACDNSGDLKKAMELYEEARGIYENIDALRTPGFAHLLRMMGITQEKRGNLEDALKLYDSAHSVYEATGTLETKYGKECVNLRADSVLKLAAGKGSVTF